MKNLHLVPVNVLDIVEKMNTAYNENEIQNYVHRLEVIRDYCIYSLDQYNKKNDFRVIKNKKK